MVRRVFRLGPVPYQQHGFKWIHERPNAQFHPSVARDIKWNDYLYKIFYCGAGAGFVVGNVLGIETKYTRYVVERQERASRTDFLRNCNIGDLIGTSIFCGLIGGMVGLVSPLWLPFVLMHDFRAWIRL